jgi:putative transposase
MTSKSDKPNIQDHMPDAETVQRELGTATSMDDFFGKEGIFARLFANTLEQMLEAELTAHLGYEKHEAKGRNSGNSRNGKTSKKLRTSSGDVTVQVPRDRNGDFTAQVLPAGQKQTNELEDKIMAMYANGTSTRDIQRMLNDLYGVEVSATTISAITDKVWPLVEQWQNRPLADIYPMVYLDAIHIKVRQSGKVENTAVYVVLGVDLAGQRDVLGHWIGTGAEGSNFWLSVVTDLQTRGVRDIFIASVDGLTGFSDAIHSVFPHTAVQRCVVHQIRNSLKYVPWKDRKAFAHDLKTIYKAPNREAAETALLEVSEKWSDTYATAIRSWENNWEELATMFDYGADIRRLIYTTNTIEGYHRQLRKVLKNKSSFSSPEAARKLLFLANQNITAKWNPIQNWALILNQLAIRFEGRFPI